jgi:dTDP-4-amino-4,6-dideoxygalactose transaminase
MKLLRDWGQEKKYHHDMIAYNYRMDAIQGAILRVKLQHLQAWTELRRSHAIQYEACLSKLGIRRATELIGRRHVYHIYSVFHPARKQLQAALQAEFIHTGMHYPIPVHLQKPYQNLGYSEGDFPVTEQAAKEQLSLPMFAELTHEQVSRVAAVVNAWVERNNAG